MVGTAGKRTVPVMTCTKRANAVGESGTVGGMKTAIAGTATAIGTIAITTVTNS